MKNALKTNALNGFTLKLSDHQKSVDKRLQFLQDQNFSQRLWNKDKSLWPGNEISLGWLDVTEKIMRSLPMIEEFCKSIKHSGFDHIVLLGMGGSSLAPFVFQQVIKPSSSEIKFTVLDSTDPKTIQKTEQKINISTTLFIVASKSGSTAEVMAFYNYFYTQVFKIKGADAGENFIAITDEGSPLVKIAEEKTFRKIFVNFPDIGGRYSALSYFGIVPAALMGINIRELLKRTRTMADACGPEVPASENPGIVLGTAIAELASQGRDKLTYMMPSELISFGLWLEQLLAESTGKNGKGILPVKGDALNEMSSYGKDRLFLYFGFRNENGKVQSQILENYLSINHPLLKIQINDELDLGSEFLRWEVATATAGYLLGINPFDQPNVEESKKCTFQLLRNIEQGGKLPAMDPTIIENSLHYYTTQKASALLSDTSKEGGLKKLMENFWGSTRPGDYITLQAYLPEEQEVHEYFSQLQYQLQKDMNLAITLQFGPRYLHSTGQFHKGGPNTGHFIQFIYNSSPDIQIPGQAYTFNSLKRAQAIGDMEALIKHNRNVILIDLGKNYLNGLNSFKDSIFQNKAQKISV